SLHHMTAVEQVLAEMVRVLKPGGHIIISEVYQGEMSEQQYTHMHLHHWWARVDRALGVPHNETYTRPDLIALIDALNLRDLQLLDFNPESGDPFDAERREFLHQRAEKTYERAQDLPDFAAIKARGEELLHRLDTVGFQSAPVLVAIGRKG
ncbi:MAG: methyltransferase domain-containing protein, partial [Anaerolineae bacterium]|nr:methyltransferase domain-containing protein [Anaerolineae bacterium]